MIAVRVGQESWCFHHDTFQRKRCRNISHQLCAKIRDLRVDRAKAVNITVTPSISNRHIRIADAKSSVVEEHHPSIYFQTACFSETSCDFANFRFGMRIGFDFTVARESRIKINRTIFREMDSPPGASRRYEFSRVITKRERDRRDFLRRNNLAKACRILLHHVPGISVNRTVELLRGWHIKLVTKEGV